MSRRQGMPSRPASSEEIECWNHAAASLSTLSALYSGPATMETISRVNRLISAWPSDDTLPAEGLDSVKGLFKKLVSGLDEIRLTSEKEIKAIDNAMEQLGILIALRKAPEIISQEKRNKRPRAASPSAGGTPVPQVPSATSRGPSIVLPPRNSGTPANTVPREPKSRREAWAKQLPLQEGRQVAFHPPPSKNPGSTTEPEDNNWILAVVDKCINGDKNRYEVHDPETTPVMRYNTTLRSIIPLPDTSAPLGDPSSLSAAREFPVGSNVLALYPDTSTFYRAEVVATPSDSARLDATFATTYKVKFEDDDNQELLVQAQYVVEWPGPR